MVVSMRVDEALRPASSAAVIPAGVAMGVEGPINDNALHTRAVN